MRIDNYWARMFVRGIAISILSLFIMLVILVVYGLFTLAFAAINPALGIVMGLVFAIIVVVASFMVHGWVATKVVKGIK